MNKTMQIYYTAVLGALGGLLGWWIMGSLPTGAWNVWLAYPLVGMGLGACIGGCVAATDGAVIKRSASRAVRDGLAGGLVGGLAGLAGLLLAELGFLAIGGGLSDLLVRRRLNRALYGAAGGVAGGLVGGALYELMTQAFLAQSDRAQTVVGGVGLIVLGACIGGLIPLARLALARGELRVLSGEQAGLVREISDTATIGSYDGCDLYLPDRAVAWRHALVRRTAQGFALEVLPEAQHAVLIGDRPLAPGQALPLHGGERIWLGETALEFVGRA
jgi:hypothetical protein